MATLLLDEDLVPDQNLDATLALGHAIEVALDRSIGELTQAQGQDLVEQVQHWQALGGQVDAVRFFSENADQVSFCESLSRFLYNISNDPSYSAQQEDQVDIMAERILLALMDGSWIPAPEAFGEGTAFFDSQVIDVARLRARAEQGRLEQTTAAAPERKSSGMRL